ncbi:hypothetical protein [Streptomyces sp. TR02-1]|uniref:hypothetical protein n=1 Tax=Streptomyces sp. TR02-1 TaxID=3385977 RepID=UPI0039A0DC70
MRRWVKAAVAATVCVALGGWFAVPYAQGWWNTLDPCDGALPSDAVRELVPDGHHVTTERTRHVERLGSMSCVILLEETELGHAWLLEADAFTRRDDQDRELMSAFSDQGFEAQSPLPDGLPGFRDRANNVVLRLPCPALGNDASGRPRTMLVNFTMSVEVHFEEPRRAPYEAAVAFANSSSKNLGCGAEPLEVPDEDRLPSSPPDPEHPRTVPLSEVTGATCGWLTEAELPRTRTWRVSVRSNGDGPTGRCDVDTPVDAYDETDAGMTFFAWYGDWSRRLVTQDGTLRDMTATARCRGEAAHFALRYAETVPGLDPRAQRNLLKRFARNETHRRDCSGLRFHW